MPAHSPTFSRRKTLTLGGGLMIYWALPSLGHASRSAQVQSLRELLNLKGDFLDGDTVLVGRYDDKRPVGGGIFTWSADTPAKSHNGGTMLSPLAPWHDDPEAFAAFTVKPSTATTGVWKRSLPASGALTPEMFGAYGDGIHDDSGSIRLANAAAAATGASVLFPGSRYACHQIKPLVNWRSNANSTLIHNGTQRGNYDSIWIDSQKGLEFFGLTFDGNVSPDPAVWTPENFNKFNGVVPLTISTASQITFINCTFQNAFKSTVRLERSHGITFRNCVMRNARGKFGDAMYSVSCHHLVFEDCHAENYTRIGFVCEGNAEWGCSHSNRFTGCTANYGHHQSVDYGDTEYNSGFWCENTASATYIDCSADNNSRYGFFISTGVKKGSPVPVAQYSLLRCKSTRTKTGFALYSVDTDKGFATNIKVEGCTTDRVSIGFFCHGANHEDRFSITDATVAYFAGTEKDNAALSWKGLRRLEKGIPELTVSNLTIVRQTKAGTSPPEETVDIREATGGAKAIRIHIDNARISEPTDSALRIEAAHGRNTVFVLSNMFLELRNLTGFDRLELKRCRLTGNLLLRGSDNATISVQSSQLLIETGMMTGSNQKIIVDNSLISPRKTLTISQKFSRQYPAISFERCVIRLADGARMAAIRIKDAPPPGLNAQFLYCSFENVTPKNSVRPVQSNLAVEKLRFMNSRYNGATLPPSPSSRLKLVSPDDSR